MEAAPITDNANVVSLVGRRYLSQSTEAAEFYQELVLNVGQAKADTMLLDAEKAFALMEGVMTEETSDE